MFRLVAALALLVLAGCGAADLTPSASPAEVQRRAYVHDGPPEVTLYTVVNTRTDAGAHTALLINGSERVLWDPAGSFVHPAVPEQDDRHYAIDENIRRAYVDYHVRDTHYIVQQSLPMSRAQADELIRLAGLHGGAIHATCARSTSAILRDAGVGVDRTWFPKALMADFGALPGVRTETITPENVDTRHNVTFGKGGVPEPRPY